MTGTAFTDGGISHLTLLVFYTFSNYWYSERDKPSWRTDLLILRKKGLRKKLAAREIKRLALCRTHAKKRKTYASQLKF
jgi:hypothetical protein